MFGMGNVPCNIESIFDCYNNFLTEININYNLSGPTYFSNMIQEVIKLAENDTTNMIYRNYYVLVIVTDGAITDLKKTLMGIVDASELPISIVIVGVGNANFDTMDRLDGDGKLLKDEGGRSCKRDIVQFVALRN